jgi:import inner membrane translocase subunit TIM50
MLSRAVLPLTRPNALASTIRLSSLPVTHSRWYAKGNKPKAPYKLPESVKPPKADQSAQQEYSPAQAEFGTNADPQSNTANQTAEPVSR